ncbi:MAG: ATP-binding protein, partial [Erysipelotrichaceae bacterium]|nr:ATP-binding protein [Erysipelotrichaceae bacterium]
LKDNSYLALAMLTGIQRVAKENIFSKLNNPVICTVADKKYSQYFGFTEDETKELLEYYGLELNEEVKAMYDGYHIGNTDVYNPWSILNYADNQEIETYWVDTSANTMIINAMKNADTSFRDGFETLIKQNYLNTNVKMGTSFYEKSETSTLWGLFINAGYLTADKKIKGRRYRIRIPNLEVVDEFKELLSYYMDVSSVEFLDNVIDSLQDKDEKGFIDAYKKLLLVPSYYDFKNENSYHMLLFPLCLYLSNKHEVKSNSEEGKGRTDIILKARNDKYASYVIEFKFDHKDSDDFEKLADDAYQQIIREKYDATLKGRVIYIGLGVRLKEAAMKWIVRD